MGLAVACKGDVKTGPSDIRELLAVAGDGQTAAVQSAVPVQPVVLVRDGDGVPLAGLAVNFAVTSGGGTVVGGSITTGTDGRATAGTWTLGQTAGPQTLQATSPDLPGQAVTFTATATAGDPAETEFTVPPPDQSQLGVPFNPSPQVRLRDQFGNLVARAGHTVDVTILAGAGGGLLGPQHVLTDAAGVADFSGLGLSGNTGSYTLSFSAPGSAAVEAMVEAQAGNPAETEFTVAPPAHAQVGVPFSPAPRVRLRDQFGNLVVRAGHDVEVTVVAGAGGGLLGPQHALTDAAGVADFTGLGLVGHTGTYTLGFSAPGAAAAHADVAADPGPAAELVMDVAPPVLPVNAIPFNPQPSFHLEDASGNPLGQAGFTVTAALVSGTGTLGGTTTVAGNAGGTAAFTNLVLNGPAGTYRLSFTTPGLTPLNSPDLTLQAGSASQVALLEGDGQSGRAGTLVPVSPAVIVRDQGGNPVSGVSVTFSVLTGGGSVTGGTDLTDAAGVARVGSWRLGNVAGMNQLQAVAPGLSGSPVIFQAIGTPGPAASIARQAGDQQSAPAGSAVPVRPSVIVKDQLGNPVAGYTVQFQVTAGGGSITGSSPVTNQAGIAIVGSWTLGTVAGTNTLQAVGGGLAGSPVAFTATGVPGPATTIALDEGDDQNAPAGTAVPVLPAVMVTDQHGNPVPGVAVTFVLTGGGGTITGGGSTTDPQGIARVGSWTLGSTPGLNTLEARAPGLSGSPIEFTANGTGSTALTMALEEGNNQVVTAGTPVPVAPAVKISDQNNQPAVGVSVTFLVNAGGGSATGTQVVTDAAGVARVGSWTLGPVAGLNRLRALSAGVIGSPVIFTATGIAGAPAQVTIVAGDGQSAIVSSPVPIPPAVLVRDAGGNPVPGEAVHFAVTGGGGSVTGGSTVTDAAGVAAVGSWTLGPTPGPNGLQATAATLPGSPVQFNATANPVPVGPPDSLIKLSGDGQTVAAGMAAPESLVVRVVDSLGQAIAGQSVTWQALAGSGSVSPGAVSSDGTGRAATQWTAGAGTGLRQVRALVNGLSAIFSGTVVAGSASALAVSTPPGGAVSGQDFTTQPVIQLVDGGGNPVSQAGIAVTVQLFNPSPFASLGGTLTATTAANGRATFTDLRILGPITNYQLRFTAPGLTAVTSAPFSLASPTGRVPLNDLAGGSYLGFTGGLYAGGSNAVPTPHAVVGAARARNVRPRSTNGSPSPNGRFVLMSIGVSNATQEWCDRDGVPCNPWSFTGQAAADPAVNHTSMVVANGARTSAGADSWDSPADPDYDRIRDSVLAPLGVTEAQVEVIWLKTMNPDPTVSLPAGGAEANVLVTQYGNILRTLRTRYPNLQMVFMSSRSYGGYSTGISPEPFAYETGFGVKWVIQAQVDQMANGGSVVDGRAGDLNYNTVAPWAAWGPYFWADGLNPRSDGLTWEITDYRPDGVHPSMDGEIKVANRLLAFFKTDPRTSCWFLSGMTCP